MHLRNQSVKLPKFKNTFAKLCLNIIENKTSAQFLFSYYKTMSSICACMSIQYISFCLCLNEGRRGLYSCCNISTTGKLSRRNLFGMSHFLLKIPPTAEPGGLKELRHYVTMYVCSFVSVVQNYSNQSYSKFCYLICLMCFTN